MVFRKTGGQQNMSCEWAIMVSLRWLVDIKPSNAPSLYRAYAGDFIVRPNPATNAAAGWPDNAAYYAGAAASTINAEGAIIKNVRDAQAIGDNAQMIWLEQRARHLPLNRRSTVIKYRIIRI